MKRFLIDILEPYKRAVSIDSLVSHRIRTYIRRTLGFLMLGAFITSLFSSDILFDGLALFLFGFFLISLAFEYFYNSSKFSKASVEYAVALAFFGSDHSDLTRNFILSLPGSALLFRLGISKEEGLQFLGSNRTTISYSDFSLDLNKITFQDYTKALYEIDGGFKSFVSTRGIHEEEYSGAAKWIGSEFVTLLKNEHWWSKENLSTISSLGTTLDYGMSTEVSRYSIALEREVDLLNLDLDDSYRLKEVSELETVLVRSAEANALIVDDDESVARTIIAKLLRKIRLGTVPKELEHMHILKLDWNALVADFPVKASLEPEILKILINAESSGNTIIYIPNFPAFIASTQKIGVALPSLIEDHLHSTATRVIAHSTRLDFHYLIETNSALTRSFERIIPDEAGSEASIPAIIEAARRLENSDMRYSYPALLSIAESAERYIPYGEMPAKAIDLLIEITPWIKKQNKNQSKTMLTKSDVLSFITFKTGIATGTISGEEEDKLNHLEDILHSRIVGQEKAVSSVAQAMRRARSGLSNPKKPFASFLFLGPTGVGKTETSKALAQSFFGGADKMIRFDMSQYNEANALPDLVGSTSSGNPGLLSSRVRDNPYGVLLLDEFEKASPDVRDLFLQVLDEGEYTDALGSKVNCRNLIIIATSNAGSDLIWKLVGEGKDLNTEKDKIINTLIEQHIYKPELLNRFDDIVVFHPLTNTQFNEVANKMFQEFAARIEREKQIKLTISPELLSEIVSKNNDTEFGARSVGRVIQNTIEDILARKIISKEVSSGSTLEITSKDVV